MIIPKECEKDLNEIPPTIAKKIEIVLSEHIDDILAMALKPMDAAGGEAAPALSLADPDDPAEKSPC